MGRDVRFWRNVAIIAVAHAVVLLALVRTKSAAARSNVQEVVWMSGGAGESARSTPLPAAELKSETTPVPAADEPAETPDATPATSEIRIPTPTPVPTPRPTVTPPPVAKVSPKPSATGTPKATPKKPVAAKATPKPSPKKESAKKVAEEAEKKLESAKIAPSPKGNAAGPGDSQPGGQGSSAGKASEFNWYGKMLHDRFFKEWAQPTSVVATGAKMSVVVRIRIEKNGRVSSFTIVQPSGNVVVDESVAAVANRVTQVDPLPKGLGSRDYYEVNINFAFNADK